MKTFKEWFVDKQLLEFNANTAKLYQSFIDALQKRNPDLIRHVTNLAFTRNDLMSLNFNPDELESAGIFSQNAQGSYKLNPDLHSIGAKGLGTQFGGTKTPPEPKQVPVLSQDDLLKIAVPKLDSSLVVKDLGNKSISLQDLSNIVRLSKKEITALVNAGRLQDDGDGMFRVATARSGRLLPKAPPPPAVPTR